MGTFRAIHRMHEALAARLRTVVAEVAEAEGLGPVEVYAELGREPAAGDDASVHVALARLAPNRDLNFGPARRPSPLSGEPAALAATRGRGLYQRPPLCLDAWFVVAVRSESARAADLLLGGIACSLHLDPTVTRQLLSFPAAAEEGSSGTVSTPHLDSRGRPVVDRPGAPHRDDAFHEKLGVTLVADLAAAEVDSLLSSHGVPLGPTLQVRAGVRMDAPVEALLQARGVDADVRVADARRLPPGPLPLASPRGAG